MEIETVHTNSPAFLWCGCVCSLISHAGSLTNLSKYPASTVQILGAEKALFRCVQFSLVDFAGQVAGGLI